MSEPKMSNVAIIGAGTMGAKIAHRCMVSGLTTRLYDKYPKALEGASDRISAWLKEWIGQGHLSTEGSKQARDRLQLCSVAGDCIPGVGMVIETVPEDVSLKREVLAEIDPLLPEDAFICTNSSSLPCSRIADVLSRPGRFFNINFSNPQDPSDRLVELMRGKKTSDDSILAGVGFVRSLGMVPVVTYREIMGFSFNRVWRAIKRETLHLVDAGYSDYQDLDRAWMLEFGTPFGPFGLMDIVGLDVIRDIEYQYFQDSGDERDRPPKMLDEMIRDGKLGVKSGEGFYLYPDPSYREKAWLSKEGDFAEDVAAKLVEMRSTPR